MLLLSKTCLSEPALAEQGRDVSAAHAAAQCWRPGLCGCCWARLEAAGSAQEHRCLVAAKQTGEASARRLPAHDCMPAASTQLAHGRKSIKRRNVSPSSKVLALMWRSLSGFTNLTEGLPGTGLHSHFIWLLEGPALSCCHIFTLAVNCCNCTATLADCEIIPLAGGWSLTLSAASISVNMALLRTQFTRLISLQSFQSVPALAQACAAARIAGGGAQLSNVFTSVASTQQTRTVISAPVQNNKIGKAMRTITRRVFADGILTKWRAQEYYVKPTKARFIARKDTDVRLRKEEFREKLRWAMQRKARCVQFCFERAVHASFWQQYCQSWARSPQTAV